MAFCAEIKLIFFRAAVAPTGVVTCLFAPHFAVLPFWSSYSPTVKSTLTVKLVRGVCRRKIHQIISSRIPAVLKKEMFEAGTNLMLGPRSRSRPSESKADILPPLFVVGRKEGGGAGGWCRCRFRALVPMPGSVAGPRVGGSAPRGLVRRWPRSQSSRAASRSSSPGQDPP